MADHAPHDAPASPDALIAHAWDQLRAGVASAKHGFHLPTLATVSSDGLPDARIVVLRAVDQVERRVACHTDVRSPKVAHLAVRPFAAWTFYDASRRLQARVAGPAVVQTDTALAQRQWDASQNSSKRCYLAPHAPGIPADEPSPNLPEHVRDRVPDAPELEPGRINFAVLITVVTSIDVLHLHHAGHRRARATCDDTGTMHATWVEV